MGQSPGGQGIQCAFRIQVVKPVGKEGNGLQKTVGGYSVISGAGKPSGGNLISQKYTDQGHIVFWAMAR